MKKIIYIFCFFIFFEFFCRFVLGLGNPILSRKHPTIEYEFVPNQKVNRFHRKIKINSYGMRSDEIQEIKDPRKIRVLVYGDSVIYGGSLISQKNISTELLKKKKLKNSKLEIANISAGSWGPGNWLSVLKERGTYNADIIILVISSHDWNDNPQFNYTGLVEKKPLSAASELFTRYLLPKLKKQFIALKNLPSKEAQNGNKNGLDDLKSFIDLIKQKQIEFVIVQFWDREEFQSGKPKKGNILIKKVIDEKNVISLQSIYKFKECSKNHKDLYSDSIHPFTKLGQKCLSETIFDAMKLTKFNKIYGT
tara:strand:+ start:2114 stop:3037 length:924 start_codon:yes stop_codon:yes gene_type:complete